MLYQVNSGYFRQFLSYAGSKKNKTQEVNTSQANIENRGAVNPKSVGM